MTAHILEWSLRAALMAGGTGLVLRLLRVKSAAARHRAWTAVAVLMALLPAWTAWGPKIAAPVLPPQTGALEYLVTSPQAGPGAQALPSDATPAIATVPQTTLPAAAGEIAALPTSSASRFPWEWIAIGCYFVVTAFILTRLIIGTLRAGVLVRRATDCGGFLASRECAVPVTVGWFRPSILLPANWREWPAEKLEAVLTHEREHVRRRDPLAQWVALLNRAIFCFHPLSWWLERRIAALAEDACDSAVLRNGHDPSQYSEYLIDMARDVERAGGSIPLWGAAMASGTLKSRIVRILRARPEPQLSRRNSVLAIALCGAVLAAFAACKLERAQKPAEGQVSMAEMYHRFSDKMRASADRAEAELVAFEKSSPAEAEAAVEKLKANPQDDRLHLKLVRYYQAHGDVKGMAALSLWYIQNQPGGTVWPSNIDPRWDASFYERGKASWLAHAKQPGASAVVFQRAASYVQQEDLPLAEQILLSGQKAHPEDQRWNALLADVYAMALSGRPYPYHGEASRVAQVRAPGRYSRSVREKLAASSDAPLLTAVAWRLFPVRMPMSTTLGPVPEMLAIAKDCVSRALAIQPDYDRARTAKTQLEEIETSRRLKNAAPDQLSESDRLKFLRRQLEQEGWLLRNLQTAESKARETLEIAKRLTNDPEYGTAVYQANYTLGKAALKRGDRQKAAQHLLAASEAPATDVLRYSTLPMGLPRELVDWGEREAVATFLERVSKYNVERGKDMAQWAAQLRKGVNPDLFPYGPW